MSEMLKVENLNVSYGAIHAVKGISFSVNAGEIITLIGANGAGKTTTMHAISGLIRSGGGITFCGQSIHGMAAHKIVKLGLAQVSEGRRVFAKMTVQENLEMGAYGRKDKAAIADDLERIFQRLPRLQERRRQMAGTLSGGEQQMLAIGRAVMAAPKMLLLDEPSMGLSPILVHEVFSYIQDINAAGVTILLVEQNAKMALSIASRAYVLETGAIAMSGDAEALAKDPQVQRVYLGG